MALVLLPLLFVVAASFSDPDAVITGKVWFWPVGPNIEAYKMIFKNADIINGYRNTIVYTLVGTGVNLVLTICAAYPLSRREFAGRNVFIMLMVFTMYFDGGLIPTFLNVRNLRLIDSMWALILPVAVSTFNIIITRTFFVNAIPNELHEAATIDGSSHIRTLLTIVMPLSKPVLAVITLYYAVSHWNSYFSALLYINTRTKFPLQIILREILVLRLMPERIAMTRQDMLSHSEQLKRGELLKYAVIVAANLPVLMIYPMIQKYFVQGVMIGSIKG